MVPVYEYLCVLMDDLSFKPHVETLLLKIRIQIFFCLFLFSLCSKMVVDANFNVDYIM